MDDCDFGRQLAYVRLRNGLRQSDLAKHAGLSVRCISDLERGIHAAPRIQTLHKLLACLDLPPSDRQALVDMAIVAQTRARLEVLESAGRARRRRRTVAEV